MAELSENPAYGFAIGRVRALEGALLGRAQYDRLVRVGGVDEFASALGDAGYSRFFDGTPAAGSVEAALNSALADYTAFFEQYALDPWLARLFRLPSDIENLKSAVKQSRIGVTGPQPVKGGEWSAAQLAALVVGEKSPGVEPTVAVALRPLLGEPVVLDPVQIDGVLDRLEHDLSVAIAKPSPFLLGFFGLHADIENARTAARLKVAGEPASTIDGFLLSGGKVGGAQLRLAIAGDWDAFTYAFAGTAAARVVEEGAARFADSGTLLHWERLGREAELAYLRGARYAVFGHEPLAAFHYYRLNELRNLRGLNAAHRSGLGIETTQELVAYVD
ncbi:MAG: V-type ATPase subunit [bacterium]